MTPQDIQVEKIMNKLCGAINNNPDTSHYLWREDDEAIEQATQSITKLLAHQKTELIKEIVGALPEVERGHILIGIMPHNPATIDIVGDFRKDKSKDFTKPIDEHSAIRLQDTQTLLNPLFAPE